MNSDFGGGTNTNPCFNGGKFVREILKKKFISKNDYIAFFIIHNKRSKQVYHVHVQAALWATAVKLMPIQIFFPQIYAHHFPAETS